MAPCRDGSHALSALALAGWPCWRGSGTKQVHVPHGITPELAAVSSPLGMCGLGLQDTQSESWEREDKCNIMQCVYIDNSPVWRGQAVKIDLSYDIASRYLLKAYIQVSRDSNMETSDVEGAFFEELERHGVLLGPEEGAAESSGALPLALPCLDACMAPPTARPRACPMC